ncbi:hypothetical protein H7U19_10230 [Hyunsoonleella sp. SJ7]|uniref:Uncharacterized protein n=1 Tax=Hyunsoonleella aquatilis TaxID=2762758 RepID=A0A923KGP1_9FLAO|nr:hypothetical protein [Hyunsoonleella aquatilis]MBC3758781.1 hypothetical protein [Hyunsoonleella aquatilis]
MLIKFIIVVISSLLLVNESFGILEKFKKKNKKIILIIVLALLFVFSIIDVINTVREGDELLEKANTIIRQSDTLTVNTRLIEEDLRKNIESVKETGKSLAKIDSVLKGVRDSVSDQVEILKGAVEKSKELVRLEEVKFRQNEAKLIINSKKAYLIRDTINSSMLEFKYTFENKGQRDAKNIKPVVKIYYYRSSKDELNSINMKRINDQILPLKMANSDGIDQRFSLKININPNELDKVIFVLGINYTDDFSYRRLKTCAYLVGENLTEDTIDLVLLNDRYMSRLLNKKLSEDALHDYLIELKNL